MQKIVLYVFSYILIYKNVSQKSRSTLILSPGCSSHMTASHSSHFYSSSWCLYILLQFYTVPSVLPFLFLSSLHHSSFPQVPSTAPSVPFKFLFLLILLSLCTSSPSFILSSHLNRSLLSHTYIFSLLITDVYKRQIDNTFNCLMFSYII